MTDKPQPMETAPREDHEEVLAYWPVTGDWSPTYWIPITTSTDKPHWYSNHVRGCIGLTGLRKKRSVPTHWLPMPPAPESP